MSENNLSRRQIAVLALTSIIGASAAAASAPEASSIREIDRLSASEEIKKLKARYFRFVDTQKWDDLQGLFTADAKLSFPGGNPSEFKLADWIAITRDALKDTVTVHHGYMPEINILSPTAAEGVWGMSDHLYLPPENAFKASELIGAGHYHETYERRNGKWLITSLRLTRLRLVTISVPKRIDE